MIDHDQRFKQLIKEFLPEFFSLFFTDWYDRFDLNQVTWLDKELFVAPPQGERSFLDLLAQIAIRSSPKPRPNEPQDQLVLLHIEIESAESVESFRRRMYDYYHYLTKEQQRDVLPIAVYLKVGLKGRGTDRYQRWFWEQHVLTFEYNYVGLPGLEGSTFLGQTNPLGIALSSLMHWPREQRVLAAIEALERLVAAGESAWRKLLLCECVQAYAPLDENQQIELTELLHEPERKGVIKMGKTWTEIGEEKCYKRGLEEGQLKGKTEAMQQTLLRLGRKRFGEPDAMTLRALLSLKDEIQLASLAERLLDVGSWAELLG